MRRVFPAVLLGLWSLLSAGEAQAAVGRANVAVQSVRLTDNGDNDGFADPHETVQVFVTLRNRSGSDQQGIVVRLASTDPTVACIPTPVVSFGALLAGEIREASMPLEFQVANVARTDPSQDLSATLEFVVSGNEFNSTVRPQSVTLDVDLNVSGGFLPTTYTEGFEGAGFGSFTTQTLDVGRESLSASQGFRCQYNDPDFVNSNSYGNTACFLGAALPSNNAYDWHVHGLGSPDGGRAYLGNNSLHWGVHAGAASADTTRLKQLDAIRVLNTLNLGWNGVVPELSFKHQVGLVDCDYLPCSQGFDVDRGIVQLQLANSAGQAVGAWRTISPYENLYDSRARDFFSQCTFDPTDDGSTEDDYFDPGDPVRQYGPSSSCYPEFSFSRQGAIGWDTVFNPSSIGHASDGPGLQGVRGPGTWVQTKFSLDRWRGRRVRLRFLATSMEFGDVVTWHPGVCCPPPEFDDGWYIDDVRVTNALTSAGTVSVDPADRSGLPACGALCTQVTPSLVATPAAPRCPDAFTLDASASTADQCQGGTLQYRFWWLRPDPFPHGSVSELNAELVQDWSESGTASHAPWTHWAMQPYQVDVRCSTLPTCGESTTLAVPVDPTSTAPIPFPHTIRFDSNSSISWGPGENFTALRGDLGALRASGGNFLGTVQTCLWTFTFADVLVDDSIPAPGEGMYYLIRKAQTSTPCTVASWSTGSAREMPGAGGSRDLDLALDPAACLP